MRHLAVRSIRDRRNGLPDVEDGDDVCWGREMRTIKFKGKRLDNGKWIYGGLSQYLGKCFIITMDRYTPDRRDSEMADYYEKNPAFAMTYIPVIPETVGQFTGLTDKNGKEIYEGDIVFYLGKSVVGYVINSFFPFDYTDSSYVTVIGNIHDNPELLK